MKEESLLAETKQLLRRFNLRARKRLGQRFLIDGDVLQRILSAAELTADDIVLEVGPGLGILTRELAQRARRVIAIELDDKLANFLKQELVSFPNVMIINEDILKIEPATLLARPERYKVVANLPYYITSPVLRHFLEATLKPDLMVVMVQKEVAEAIVAGPGKRSLLSISVQFYGRPTIIGKVPANSFYPAPEVDSAILRIDLYPKPAVAVDDTEGFFGTVRAGFASPRKQLANSLAQGLGWPKADVLSVLAEASIAPQRRAETLTLEEWAQLRQAYAQWQKKKVLC
ncbi:MAG: 16S rRNA (adenine(1518)-N(6)/adenine(1519)-N(6))-dimethyltransferase RsmA [Dehalococcoidia bacterium]|nr:MAG: 16S rRNA (adenine(1518)-N(6)/adenine(1519)-N(6))-dimethyltransferase RsmA [Dehalococcoidia bacterium]